MSPLQHDWRSVNIALAVRKIQVVTCPLFQEIPCTKEDRADVRNTPIVPVDWQARWIWLPMAPEQVQTTLQFRREFEWHADMGAAGRLLISASHIMSAAARGKSARR